MADPSMRSSSGKLLVMLLLAGMVAAGLWASRPAPPPLRDDPQPLFQVYRQGVPKDLLLALPLRVADEARLVAEVPFDVKAELFFSEANGTWRLLQPANRKQEGKLLMLSFPTLNPFAFGAPAGTRVGLVAGASQGPPTVADVAEAMGTEPWPELPEYTLVRLSPRGIEVTGPKGPKLPSAERTNAIVERLRSAAARLRERFPYFAAVAVPVRE